MAKLFYTFSTKEDGSMKGFNENKDVLKSYLEKINILPDTVILMQQMHGNKVSFVNHDGYQVIKNTDGLYTNKKNKFLGIRTADCLPIILYDEKKEIIGVVHAGYRGILKGVIENEINALKKLGADSSLNVIIGPSIGSCCYRVEKGRIEEFQKKLLFPEGEAMEKRDGNYFLNLQEIASKILIKNGIYKSNIRDMKTCTGCNGSQYFSYRKNPVESYGVFMTLAGLI